MDLKKLSILLMALLLISETSSQRMEDRAYIKTQTNVKALDRMAEDYWKVQDLYKNKQVPATLYDDRGNEQFFSHFEGNGDPVYYALENESSARSSKIDRIRTGGSRGLDLDGSDIEFGLWDGGAPRTSHTELRGRVNISDPAAFNFHATHVAGILMAQGVLKPARGMAPSATIDAYTSANWLGEISAWAANGGMITNHSYIIANPQSNYTQYGIYNIYSQRWDELSYHAPYLIMCTGASNNGNKGYNPDNSRYDLLASNKLGKNAIVVGACEDVLNYTGPSSVKQAFFTSWGPTDDWRIKPDITAVGTDSYSTRHGHDTDYGSGQGCSYASPVVAGGLALLQEHYHNNHSVYMRASTAKALILSTTDEAGSFDGPDFSNGWGLFNAEKAAGVISNDGITSEIMELTLDEGGVYTTTIFVDGSEPLSVAICWNDPPSDPLPGQIYNDPTPMLINDLDVRVTMDSVTYYPWRMEPNSSFDNFTSPAGKGDNIRDNVEIISVNNIPEGEYTIRVTHKGSLQSGTQDFSLIVNGIRSGLTSDSKLNASDNRLSIYPNPAQDRINIDFEVNPIGVVKIGIYDLTGRLVTCVNGNSQMVQGIDVSHLSTGIYFVQIETEGTSILLQKRSLYADSLWCNGT